VQIWPDCTLFIALGSSGQHGLFSPWFGFLFQSRTACPEALKAPGIRRLWGTGLTIGHLIHNPLLSAASLHVFL